MAPSEYALAAAEAELAGAERRQWRLRDKLGSLAEGTITIVDTPPSLGSLTINALTAGDELLIPVQCAFLAMKGLQQLLRTVEGVRRRANPELEILGLLLTMYDARTVHAAEVESRLRNHFGDRVFDTVVPRTVAFDYATVDATPLIHLRPNSPGAEAYRALAREVIDRA